MAENKYDAQLHENYGFLPEEFNGYYMSYVTVRNKVKEVCINKICLGLEDKNGVNIHCQRFTISGETKYTLGLRIHKIQKDGIIVIQRSKGGVKLTAAESKKSPEYLMTFGRNWRRTISIFIYGKTDKGYSFTHHADKIVHPKIIEEIESGEQAFMYRRQLVTDYINDLLSHKDLRF